MKNKNPIISLTGGLGNQLFQFAASQYFFKNCKLIFEWGIGKPRINDSGMPELASFKLPTNVDFLPKKNFSWLMSKSTGYQLRMGVSPRFYEKNKIVKKLIHLLGSMIGILYFREARQTYVSDSLGYTDSFPNEQAAFIIGYFQSYRWLNDTEVLDTMRSLHPISNSAEVDFYKSAAFMEKPLIVHVRLGDYKGSSEFGVLAPSYFVDITKKMLKSQRYGKVWVFSDEIEIARKYFSGFDPELIRFIGEVNSSAAHTFEVMRFGTGFVISNSTYSWWAAALSTSKNPNVIAPTPWFRGMEEPYELIPPTWSREAARWHSEE